MGSLEDKKVCFDEGSDGDDAVCNDEENQRFGPSI